MRKIFLLVSFPLLFLLVCAAETRAALAPLVNDVSPVAVEAEKVIYNEQKQLVSAVGNVLIQQDKSILKADKITYDLKLNRVYASGNVSLLSPDGMVFFTDKMEVQDNMKEGFAKNIEILLADKSRFGAKEVAYNEEKLTVLKEAFYTPCDACRGGSPLWSIRAEKVIKDEPNLMYRYYNAWFDVKGIPLLYSPYLSHPDPKVKRRSGFLLPNIGADDDLGMKIIIPYYYVINDYQDFIFSPMITSREGVLFAGNYRGRFTKGKINAEGAVTFMDSKRDWRGYLFFDGEADLNKNWRLSADLNHISDDTFFMRYGLGEYNIPWLESKLKVEGFGRQSYFSVYGMYFQEMRADVDNDTSPMLLPVMQYAYMQKPSSNYGYFTFDAYAAALNRNHGSAVQKLNTETGWHLPYIGPLGDVYKFDATLRIDGYSVQDYLYNPSKSEFSGFKGRIFPQLAAEWRYPFVRAERNSYQVFEPVVSAVLAPNGCNPDEIPNEDSVDFEFDSTNLFVNNRFAGYDRVESGSRVNYGLQWSIYGNAGGKVSAFAGQSYRFSDSSSIGEDSGLGYHSSDYVGNIEISAPVRGLHLGYSFRLNNQTLEPQRNELNFAISSGIVSLSGYYLDRKAYKTEFAELLEAKEVGGYLTAKLDKYWSFNIYETYNLLDGGKPINIGGYLKYEDECFALSANVKRDYTEDRDYKGGLSVMFYFTLKTLGDFKTGI